VAQKAELNATREVCGILIRVRGVCDQCEVRQGCVSAIHEKFRRVVRAQSGSTLIRNVDGHAYVQCCNRARPTRVFCQRYLEGIQSEPCAGPRRLLRLMNRASGDSQLETQRSCMSDGMPKYRPRPNQMSVSEHTG